MKTKIFNLKKVSLLTYIVLIPLVNYGQSEKSVINKFLTRLPSVKENEKNMTRKLRMTALYVNMDKLGNITGRIKVTGEYTRGADDGNVRWNNVYIFNSTGEAGKFDDGKKLEYMENFTYKPTGDMLKGSVFSGFPKNIENIYARNLVWDMMAVEDFAWNYTDSLHLNKTFVLSKTGNTFAMAEIGTYSHNNIQLSWTGISEIGNELCAIIEYRALYNKLDIKMEQINSKGTEQYWGNTWMSLKTGQILFAEMYSSTFQEAEVTGFKDKFVIKTIREITAEVIR